MKIEDVIKDVQGQIRLSLNENEGEDAVSWECQFGVLISRRQAQMIVDALQQEVIPHDHKLNGTVVEDEIMGQSITQPEWHMDPLALPATKKEVSDITNTLGLVIDSIDNISVRLQTIEKKMQWNL